MRKSDEDWVKKCMKYRVEGRRPVGRPRRRHGWRTKWLNLFRSRLFVLIVLLISCSTLVIIMIIMYVCI